MSFYDDRLAAVALHFFASKDDVTKCTAAIAEERRIRWGEALISIFESLPAELNRFYILIQDFTKNGERILSLMKEVDYRTGLYYLRILGFD